MYTTDIKILMVEDEKIVQITTTAMLKRLGNAVDIADTGSSAIERVKTQNYDLILMDIGLPDMQGTEVTRKIRQMKAAKRTLIVAVTGYDRNDIKNECESVGIDEIYNKPLLIDDLKAILEKVKFNKN